MHTSYVDLIIQQDAETEFAAEFCLWDGHSPVPKLDIMQAAVHPVHEELHRGHVQDKVDQVPGYAHIINASIHPCPSPLHNGFCQRWQHCIQWH